MSLIDHSAHSIEDWRPGVRTRMRVSARTGAKSLVIFEQWCAEGLGAPLHWHPVEEVLTVLSGRAEIRVGKEIVQATTGQSALIPAGTRHGFRNSATDELHMLAVLAAPVFEAHYDERAGVTRRWSVD